MFNVVFQPLDFERTWRRLTQKRVTRTNFDVYFFITEMYFFKVLYDFLGWLQGSIQYYRTTQLLTYRISRQTMSQGGF
jgi:hypothetical protein